MRPLWILGAPSAEMAAVEALLVTQDVVVAYAAGRDTVRVSLDNRARAQGVLLPGMPPVPFPAVYDAGGRIHLVDCDFIGARPLGGATVQYVGHHLPWGGPGYGLPAAQYWEASALGQVASTFGIDSRPSLRVVAAADHCLVAAYRGECPGVDPDVVLGHRLSVLASAWSVSLAQAFADVTLARDLLALAPQTLSDDIGFADLRSITLGTDTLRALPEASRHDGVPYLLASPYASDPPLRPHRAPVPALGAVLALQARAS